MSFTRNLTAGNFDIKLDSTKAVPIIWAFSDDNSPALSNHHIHNRGAVALNFVTGSGKVLVGDPNVWYLIHGSLMAAIFALLLPSAGIMGRLSAIKPTLKQRSYRWLHFFTSLVAIIAAAVGAIIAFTKFLGNMDDRMKSAHGILGVSLLALLGMEFVNGIVCKPHQLNSSNSSWRIFHKVLGVVLVLGGAVEAYLGLSKYKGLTGIRDWIYIAVYACCLCAVLVPWAVLQVRRRHDKERDLAARDGDLVAASRAGGGRAATHWPPPGVQWPPTPSRSPSITSERLAPPSRMQRHAAGGSQSAEPFDAAGPLPARPDRPIVRQDSFGLSPPSDRALNPNNNPHWATAGDSSPILSPPRK